MKIIYTHINTRTRKRTHTRAHAFKYTHAVWWPLKVWYNIGCAGNSAYECRVLSLERRLANYLCMHVCVMRAVCDVYVTHMIDVCQRPIAPSAFIFMSPVSAGNQPSNQPTNHRDNEHNENVVDFFTIPIKSSGFASLFKFSWVHSASRVAAPLLIAFMVLSTLVVVSLCRLCLSRNRSHSYSHNAVALIKWHASI